jgi:N6-adenosine-specific RNA methylase IME4
MALGDWLNYGEGLLGERYAQAAPATGYHPEFLRKVKWVAARVPYSERKPGLSFGHYRAVASIKDDRARQALLYFAGEQNVGRNDFERLVSDLKSSVSPRGHANDSAHFPETEVLTKAQEIRARQIEVRDTGEPLLPHQAECGELPSKRYTIILADPPWPLDQSAPPSAQDKPPFMTEAQLTALDVASVAADEAVLFMWTSHGMLDVALRVMDAWGFIYRAEWVWIKDKPGTGDYALNMHEICLIGSRGDLPAPERKYRPLSILERPRSKNPEKPKDEIRRRIEDMYPSIQHIELFGTGTPSKGWDRWSPYAP